MLTNSGANCCVPTFILYVCVYITFGIILQNLYTFAAEMYLTATNYYNTFRVIYADNAKVGMLFYTCKK